MKFTDKEQADKYLLGDLTEAEREAVEERFFADEDFSRLIDEAEDDLVDEFARGELSERETRLFSRNFLISERRREKLRAARILQSELFAANKTVSSVSTSSEKSSFRANLAAFFRAPQIAFAALAVLLLIFGGWFGLKSRNTPETVKIEESNSPSPEIIQPPTNAASNQTNADSSDFNKTKPTLPNKTANANQLKAGEKTTDEPKPQIPVIKPAFASLLLLPATRSGPSQTLTLKSNVKALNLQIVNDREEDVDRFRVEVRNVDGDLIAAQNFKNTGYNRRSFNLQIPAKNLASADYQVTLKGADAGAELQNLNYFYFSIEKK